jgi:hypothetical protein
MSGHYEAMAAPWESPRVRIPFEFAGDRGLVTVDVTPNTEPLSVGKSERERGMPVCTAFVEFGARGYRGLLGWVQLVREPDAAGPYRIDPFDLFEDSTAPFAWYGLQPVLFDAPSRWREGAVDWEAHSFLTIGPWDIDRRLVMPLAGFAWGYHQVSHDHEVHLSTVRLLGSAEWDGHRPYMSSAFPGWRFHQGGQFTTQRDGGPQTH